MMNQPATSTASAGTLAEDAPQTHANPAVEFAEHVGVAAVFEVDRLDHVHDRRLPGTHAPRGSAIADRANAQRSRFVRARLGDLYASNGLRDGVRRVACDAMQGTDGCVKIAAAAAFLRAGKHESEAIGAIMTALRDPDRSVRFDAVGQLANLDKRSTRVVEALRRATVDEDDGVRRYAQWALERLAAAK